MSFQQSRRKRGHRSGPVGCLAGSHAPGTLRESIFSKLK